MEPIAQLVADKLHSVLESFGEDELAFLALTSKIERPILDRLAYALFTALRQGDCLVAREWPVRGRIRSDLAILNQGVPQVIVEAKAMASFDCTREGPRQREYADLLQRDLDRYAGAELPNTQIYVLLLATHPLDRLPPRSQGVLKYGPGFNTAFRRFTTAERVREVCERNLFACLRPDVKFIRGEASGGSAYGVRIELLWWLFGPFGTLSDLRVLRPAV